MTVKISPSDAMIAQLKNLVPSASPMDLDYDDIYMNKEENVRFKESEAYSDEALDELAASIEGVGGLLQAVGVIPIEKDPAQGNKPYILLYGYRRFLAWGRLRDKYPSEWGTKPISAVSYDAADSEAAVKVVQMIENYHRKDLNSMEIAAGLKQSLGDNTVKLQQKQIAELFGISESGVSQYLKLLELPASVQEQIRAGLISFSAARELVNRVPPDRWLELAKVAASTTFGKFQAEINKLFTKPVTAEEGGETTDAAATTGDAASGQQKQAQLLRATEISNTYIPFVKSKLEKADGSNKVFTAKDLEQARLDTLKTVTRDGSTALAKDIAPYIEEQEKAEAATKAKEEAIKKEDSFFRTQVRAVEDIVNAKIDITDTNAKRPSPAEATAAVATKVKALSDEQRKELGFELPKADDPKFFEIVTRKISDMSKVMVEERKKAAAAREEAKKKKEAEAAAAEANKPKAEGTTTPAATAAVPAAAGK